VKVKGVNKVQLLGNVGKDHTIRSTGGGTLVASFSLATSDRRKDPEGNWQDHTEWHSLVAFGRTAEVIRDYVKQGSRLFIEGKLQTRSWEDKESGQKKYRTEILVDDLTLLGDPQGKASGAEAKNGAASAAPQKSRRRGKEIQPDDEYAHTGITDDDIPF
jgi:single-strand DNA-binding protein